MYAVLVFKSGFSRIKVFQAAEHEFWEFYSDIQDAYPPHMANLTVARVHPDALSRWVAHEIPLQWHERLYIRLTGKIRYELFQMKRDEVG